MDIKTVEDFDRVLSHTKYALDSYPLFFICRDAGCLCFECADKEKDLIRKSIVDGYDKQWIPITCEINFESKNLMCDHCYKMVETYKKDF